MFFPEKHWNFVKEVIKERSISPFDDKDGMIEPIPGYYMSLISGSVISADISQRSWTPCLSALDDYLDSPLAVQLSGAGKIDRVGIWHEDIPTPASEKPIESDWSDAASSSTIQACDALWRAALPAEQSDFYDRSGATTPTQEDFEGQDEDRAVVACHGESHQRIAGDWH
jgi:hypothetical protein